MDAFRLRDMLFLTVLAAVCFCVLFAPSPGWLPVIIFGVLTIIAIAVQRSFAAPAVRPFWVSVLIGGAAYLALMLVCLGFFESDAITHYIVEPWWQRRYAELPLDRDHPEYGAYATFLLSLHVVFGGAAAALAARVAQLVCRTQEPE